MDCPSKEIYLVCSIFWWEEGPLFPCMCASIWSFRHTMESFRPHHGVNSPTPWSHFTHTMESFRPHYGVISPKIIGRSFNSRLCTQRSIVILWFIYLCFVIGYGHKIQLISSWQDGRLLRWVYSVPCTCTGKARRYYFTSSPDCSREFRVILLHYLIHFKEVFLITFPSQSLSLWDI